MAKTNLIVGKTYGPASVVVIMENQRYLQCYFFDCLIIGQGSDIQLGPEFEQCNFQGRAARWALAEIKDHGGTTE